MCDGLVLLLGDLGLGLLEDRRLLELQPHPEADEHQHGGEQERDAPAPGLEVRRRSGTRRARTAHRWRAGCPAARRPAATRTRSRAGRRSPCSAAISTAPPHSPPTAKPCTSRQTSSRIGARDADGGVRRQQADREGARRPSSSGRRRASSCGRPGHRSGRRPRRRAAGRRSRARRCRRPAACAVTGSDLGEEQLAEDQGGGRAVEEEVVPLDGGADQAGEDDLDDAVAAGRRARARPAVHGCVLAWTWRSLAVFMRRSSRRPSGMSCR